MRIRLFLLIKNLTLSDANNLYGYIQRFPLPTDGYRIDYWAHTRMEEFFANRYQQILNGEEITPFYNDEADEKKGYFVRVDLEYPEVNYIIFYL